MKLIGLWFLKYANYRHTDRQTRTHVHRNTSHPYQEREVNIVHSAKNAKYLWN